MIQCWTLLVQWQQKGAIAISTDRERVPGREAVLGLVLRAFMSLPAPGHPCCSLPQPMLMETPMETLCCPVLGLPLIKVHEGCLYKGARCLSCLQCPPQWVGSQRGVGKSAVGWHRMYLGWTAASCSSSNNKNKVEWEIYRDPTVWS